MSERDTIIHGPRRDLRGVVADPTSLVTLTVLGHNIDSLAGLEAMTSLHDLEISDFESPDLSLLDALPGLRQLVLERIVGAVDYAPLERATNLRQLAVTTEYPEHAGPLAQVDFGRLCLLRNLTLGGGYFEPEVALDVAWLEHLTELETLEIWNFLIDVDALIGLTMPPRLAWLRLDVRTRDELERLDAAFPDVTINGYPYEDRVRDTENSEQEEDDAGPRMDIDEFWSLIERARDAPETGHDGQARSLEALLRGRSHDELAAFERQYRAQLQRSSRWDLWGAGYLIQSGMSDDSFDYFCDFLIGCGREIFERAVTDPDGLIDVPEVMGGSLENELLRYAVYEAHEKEYGDKLPISRSAGGMTGEEWDEDGDDLARLLPRLWASAGWDNED